jgi:hypothetical protein
MHPFRKAIEARDMEAMEALFADNAVLTSPVSYQPYPGKPLAAAIIRGVARVFEDFRYVKEIADGRDHVLVFRARVGDKEVHGCDIIHDDDNGLIDDITVMVRPLSGAMALAEAMRAQFDRIQQEAQAG